MWSTISGYGSRTVVADPDAVLSEEERFEHYIYAPTVGGPTEGAVAEAVVPGHLARTPMVEKIVRAQEEASAAERSTWIGDRYSREASELKAALMHLAHDDAHHVAGGERTMLHLQQQARVYWVGMHEEVQHYVDTCFRCEFAKAVSHSPAKVGELNPTIAPGLHHTWYVDLKGPMPHA
jgi:hypothetical protein